jgi:hypothetical protein
MSVAARTRRTRQAAFPAALDRRFEAIVFDWDGTAVPDRSADDWFANHAAVEIGRVLHLGGVLAILWNEPNEDLPSPLPPEYRRRLEELQSDSPPPPADPHEFIAGGPFGDVQSAVVEHEQVSDRASGLAFAASVSWWRAATTGSACSRSSPSCCRRASTAFRCARTSGGRRVGDARLAASPFRQKTTSRARRTSLRRLRPALFVGLVAAVALLTDLQPGRDRVAHAAAVEVKGPPPLPTKGMVVQAREFAPMEVRVAHSGLGMVLVSGESIDLLEESWKKLGVYFLCAWRFTIRDRHLRRAKMAAREMYRLTLVDRSRSLR